MRLAAQDSLPKYEALYQLELNREIDPEAVVREFAQHRLGLERLMVVDPATRRSAFYALKAPPKAATLYKDDPESILPFPARWESSRSRP